MNKSEAVEEHYTAAQVGAKLGGMHPKTAHKLFRPGKIWPVLKLSRKTLLVPASSVNRYLESLRWEPKPVNGDGH